MAKKHIKTSEWFVDLTLALSVKIAITELLKTQFMDTFLRTNNTTHPKNVKCAWENAQCVTPTLSDKKLV
jgi:hypothetical protein